MSGSRVAAWGFALGCLGSLILAAAYGEDRSPRTLVMLGLATLSVPVAALLLDRAPRNPVSLLLAVYLGGLFFGAGPLTALRELSGVGDHAGGVLGWAGDLTWALGLPVIPLMITVLPDGVPRGWARWLWRAQVTGLGLVVLGVLVGFPGLNLPGVGGASAGEAIAMAGGALLVASLPVSTGRLLVRAARDRRVRREAGPFLVVAIALTVLYVLGAPIVAVFPAAGPFLDHGLPLALVVGLAPATIGYSVLRNRLFGVDVFVGRFVVAALATGVLALGYLGVVVAAGLLLGARDQGAALLVPALLAFAFLPAYRHLTLLVSRALFGRRGEPLQVLRKLGEQLTATPPDGVAERLVREVATAMRLPWVGVDLVGDAGSAVVAEAGTHRADVAVEEFTITYAGSPVGALTVQPRRGEHGLGALDRRLLREVAGQAAPAVAASRYFAELAASRDRLVEGREDERARLRRELHDGLSPALAGISLALTAARRNARTDVDLAEQLIDQARSEAASSWADVRRMLDDLGPVGLEETGLGEALSQRGRALTRPGEFELTVHADPLPPLATGVEVAAYRIAVEAMTNAARHSGAAHCEVALCSDESELLVTVRDDGVGLAQGAAPGVGMASMAARAGEVGGSLAVESSEDGTTLTAHLPLGG